MRALVLVLLAAGGLGAARADREVTAAGTSFTPKTLRIAVGDTVTWRNDGGSHSVRFDDGSYDSGDPTAAAVIGSHTFAAEGSFPYYCELHGQPGGKFMSGRVLVGDEEPQPTPTATATPTVTVSPGPTPYATPATIGGVKVKRRLRAGRLRGSAAVSPPGTRLVVAVSRRGRVIGRATVEAAGGRTRFATRLARSARKRLAARGRLKVRVVLRAAEARERVTVTLRA